MTRYKYVLDEGVFAEFLKAKGRERDSLLRAFQWLADNPQDKGDPYRLTTSRPVFMKRFKNWMITYWPDHFVCELRIVEIALLDP